MAHYKKVEYGKKPNFLASEVGLRVITGGLILPDLVVDHPMGEFLTADGKYIVPAGIMQSTDNGFTGILFDDIEVIGDWDETIEASFVVAGHVYKDKVDLMPTVGDEQLAEITAKQGLYFETSDTITRPTE